MPSANMGIIMAGRMKAYSKAVDIGDGLEAFEYMGLIEIHTSGGIIRERCPGCRGETVIDLEKRMMTCDNKNCRYFEKRIPGTVKKRRKRKTE